MQNHAGADADTPDPWPGQVCYLVVLNGSDMFAILIQSNILIV